MTYTAIPSAVRDSAVNRFISATISRLRQLNQLDVQGRWRGYSGDRTLAQAIGSWPSWAPITPTGNQIRWNKGRQVLWLAQRIVVPHNLQGYYLQDLTLRLALSWWADKAQIYVNGQLVQEGDLFDSVVRILLSRSVKINDGIEVLLRLESPNHDNGALVKALCLYERSDQAVNPTPEPAFVADELAVLQEISNAFAPNQLDRLQAAIAKLPWNVLTLTDRLSFDRALIQLREELKPLSSLAKSRQIDLVGHAHLDMAWLWPIHETWQVAEKTFRSVLNLQQTFPELTFCHTSPAIYAWLEQNRPDLFAAIQTKVQQGRWEVSIGPLWIEPEMNLTSGESIARQLLYGQRYLQQKFGKTGSIAWLPDTFGFNWQLPQLLKQGGVTSFVTQKLRWNDTTQFPYALHQWQSPDGSQILSLHSAPIGQGIDPVKMVQHLCDWETRTGIAASLWLPGVGDHGGGPTRDMLELVQRWQQSPFFPPLRFTTVEAYLKQIQSAPIQPQPTALPRWNSELYLEFHRGCYTNHADQKRFNRRCEDTLAEAELFASLRTLLTKAPYPQTELEAAWKKVLLNQFHDILPGTSIPPVFIDANRDWQAALDSGWNIRRQSIQGIAAQIARPAAPHPQAKRITVFNGLSWARSEVVVVSIDQAQEAQACFWQITDLNNQEIPSQPHCWREGGKTYCQIFFRAEVPAIGYRCFWLTPRSSGNPVPALPQSGFRLENDRLRVVIDPATGNLAQLLDKRYGRDLLSRGGNELQAFRDQGQYWDAWNIDPKYGQYPLPAAQLVQLFYEDWGNLTQRIRVIRRLNQSTFNQVYSLDQNSAVLKIETRVDWQERHILVKASFPFNINAAYASYEIPCGAIQRSTRPQTAAEQAQWEVSALRWADLSDTATSNSYGISLLSDCKHGYDAKPNQLRLTLLRGSEWPDPNSDRGQHQFTYAVYPHDRDWQTGQTVRRAHELNQPLQVLVEASSVTASGNLPPVGEFLSLPDNFLLTAFKPTEDQASSATRPNQWVLRGYECHGLKANLSWPTRFKPLLSQVLDANAAQVDLLEQPIDTAVGSIGPWQIASYRFNQRQS